MNFNTMETALFEQHPELNDGLQISEIRALERSISTADLNRLKKMIKLGGLMKRVCQWYDTPDVRNKFESFGLTWSREDIANKVFLISKAQMFKNIKAFELDREHGAFYLTAFKTQITRLRNNGVKVSQSLENYIKFVKELTSSETGDISTNQAADTCFMPSESDEITPETIEAEGVANEPPPSSSNERDFLYELSFKERSNDRYFKILISRDMIIEVERGNAWTASEDQFSQVIFNGLRRVEALIEEGTINFVNNG